MDYNQTLKKLGVWIDTIQKSFLILAGIETILVIIIGVASSNLYHEKYSSIWLGILIFIGFIYLIITIIKVAYNKSFPSSIIQELKAKKGLEIATESINRKDAINKYISNTILDLSKCRCHIPKQNKEIDWRLDSDKDFLAEIKTVTQTFNSVLNILLNTSNVKFTTGIYVDYFRGIKHKNIPETNSGTYLLRDDFDFQKSNSVKDTMTNDSLTEINLEIQNTLKVSFRNGKYYMKDIFFKNEHLSRIEQYGKLKVNA